MTILIFANGDLPPGNWLRPALESAATIIAADGGARHLLRHDMTPTTIIGDLDSLSAADRELLATNGATIIEYPPNKDETDLELALLHAVQHPDWAREDIHIYGVLGGRLDQMLANILLLAHPAVSGRCIRLIEPHQQAWLIHDMSTIHGEVGDLVSLIPLGGDIQIKETSGLQWALQNEALFFGPARGVSNVMTASSATIELKSGRALCIHTDRAWQR